jgi:hypothetical protein
MSRLYRLIWLVCACLGTWDTGDAAIRPPLRRLGCPAYPGIVGDSAPRAGRPAGLITPSHWHFANTSGRGDLTGHHVGRESRLVTSGDIERSTAGV